MTKRASQIRHINQILSSYLPSNQCWVCQIFIFTFGQWLWEVGIYWPICAYQRILCNSKLPSFGVIKSDIGKIEDFFIVYFFIGRWRAIAYLKHIYVVNKAVAHCLVMTVIGQVDNWWIMKISVVRRKKSSRRCNLSICPCFVRSLTHMKYHGYWKLNQYCCCYVECIRFPLLGHFVFLMRTAARKKTCEQIRCYGKIMTDFFLQLSSLLC